jgi:hypothetical protein
MLRAIHERGGTWDRVDPDTEVAGMGDEISLTAVASYELPEQLVDEGYVDPGHVLGTGGAMPGHTSRIVGREHNMTVVGDEVRLTDKGLA